MTMAWYEIIAVLAGAAGGIYTLLTIRQKKEGMVIDNLKRIIDEIRLTHEQYKAETNEKLKDLATKMDRYERKDQLQMLCINKAYRCKLAKDENVCPVVKEMENRTLDLNEINNEKG